MEQNRIFEHSKPKGTQLMLTVVFFRMKIMMGKGFHEDDQIEMIKWRLV